MTFEIRLDGLTNPPPPEDRALAYLSVNYNGEQYKWHTFIPIDQLGDLSGFLENIKPTIQAQIDEKEAAWVTLDPKMRMENDGMTGQLIEVPITRDEIVRADDMDYYAKRRAEYASVGEQLDALIKGYDSAEFQTIIDRHMAIKQTHYKLPRTLIDAQRDKKMEINRARDEAEGSGFPFVGKVFDSDPTAIKRISVAVLAASQAPDGFTIDWTTQDGSTITLSKSDVLIMPLVMATVANTLHLKARNLKTLVDASTTIEDVLAIVW